MYRKDLRPEIIQSFVEEFNQFGPKLTLDRVASKIHISKKTIYRFFRGKDDIYGHIIHNGAANVAAAQKAIYEDGSKDTYTKLKEMLLVKSSWEDRIDFSRLYELKEEAPAVYAELEEAYSSAWTYVEDLMEQGKKEGLVKNALHVRLTTSYLLSSFLRLIGTPLLKESGLTYTQAVESLVDTALNGFLN